MKIVAQAKDMKRAVKLLKKVKQGTRIESFNVTRLEAKKDNLALFATNADIWATTHIPAKIELDNSENVVGVSREFDDIASQSSDEIVISVNDEVIVNGVSIAINENIIDPIPVSNYIELTYFTGKEFKKMIDRFALMTTNPIHKKPPLYGISFKWDKKLFIASMNKYRLLREVYPLSDTSLLNGEIVVSAKYLKRITSSISAKTPFVHIGVSTLNEQQFLVLNWDNTQVMFREIPTEYPDYNRVIPSQFYPQATEIVCNTEELLAVLQQARKSMGENSRETIRLTVNNSMEITAYQTSFEQQVSSSIKRGPFTGNLYINVQYLIDYLKNCKQGEVRIALQGEEQSIRIEPAGKTNQIYVCMPIKING